MKTKHFGKWALLLFLVSLPYLAEALLAPFPGGFSITNMVKRAELVFTGEVVDLEFIFRKGIRPEATTDVTVKVSEMIKGKPNAGENLVQFMIEGGQGINPETGKEVICRVEHVPEFRKGEKALFFLVEPNTPEFQRFQNRPYGGLALLWWSFGKYPITDGEVYSPYTVKQMILIEGKMVEKDVIRGIKLPVDLVIQIIKAFLKDAQAVEALDNRIKTFVEQAPRGQDAKADADFLGVLKTEVQKILSKGGKEDAQKNDR